MQPEDAPGSPEHTLSELIAALGTRDRGWRGYAEAFEDASVALLVLDRAGVVRAANEMAARLCGRQQSRMRGKPLVALARLRDSTAFWRHLQRSIEEDAAVSTELEIALPSGEIRTVGVTSKPLPGRKSGPSLATMLVEIARHHAAGRPAPSDAAHRDRARLEAQLQASAAIAEANAAVPMQGLDSLLHAIAEEARHLVNGEAGALGIGGAPEGEFEHWAQSGVAQWARVKLPRPPRRVGLFERVTSGSPVRTSRLHCQPGACGLAEEMPVVRSLLAVPVRRRGHCFGGIYVVNHLSAREFDEDDERALTLLAEYVAFVIEAALASDAEARERARLRRVLDQLPIPVLVKDAEAHLLPNACALALSLDGKGRRDPLGRPVQWDVRFPDGRSAPWAELPLTRAFRDREATSNVEMAVVTKEGRSVPMLMSATPLVDELGRALGAVAVWIDISQQKRLEQLRKEWSAVVAHDLRQPLGAIKMWDRLLARSQNLQTEREGRAVMAIDKAVVSMNEMLEDLVDSSMVETHRVKLQKAPLSIEELIEEVVDVLAPGDSHRVRVESEPNLPMIDADRARVRRVLENLLSNAFKYGTPMADVVVTAARSGADIEVAVTNVGETLSSDEMRKLFSRFYRTPSALRERGLGLGLYIARGFIEAHGGRLSCESQQGRTTFRFTLPRRDPAGDLRQQETSA